MYLIWPGALRHAMASVWQRRALVRHRLPEKSIMMNTRLDRDWISGMRRKAASAALVLAGALVLTIITTQSAHAALTTLYNFCSQSNCADGANPNKALFQGTDGNFYGATTAGGAGAGGQYGTVFQITPSGVLTTLHSFCSQSNCADGMLPSALIQASDGNFYGTTRQGGVGAFDPYGTVFQITPSGTLTTLYNFCSQSNCTDGFFPDAALIQASDGNFYGTTSQGGVDGYGTVFKIPLSPGDTLTTIHSIVCSSESCPEGYAPETALVQATDGNFYGTTLYSAYTTQGSVFQVTPSGTFTGLYTFCHTSGCPDGAIPNAALVQGTDGNLYGTTEKGGAYAQGTVFQITPSGTLTTLYSFCATSGCPDGASPYAALVQGRGGVFYGTTYSGGAYNKGSVFQITSSGALTTLYSFCATSGCPDGASPYAALIQATDGKLYGTTYSGGANNYGTVFKIAPPPPPDYAPTVRPIVTGTQGYGTIIDAFTGWYISPTTLSWTVNGNPTPTKSGCGKVDVPNTTGKTYTCTATNEVGTTSQSITIQKDSVQPKIALSAPKNGAIYKVNTPLYATFSCTDTGLSGLEDCFGTLGYPIPIASPPPPCAPNIPLECLIVGITSGTAIDTATAAVHTFTVYASSNAEGVSGDWPPRPYKTITYTVELQTEAPVFSLKGGTYTGAQTVSITDATFGSVIYYTTDGTKPTASSTVYGGPITVSSSETLKAIAIAAPDDVPSRVTSAAYTIK